MSKVTNSREALSTQNIEQNSSANAGKTMTSLRISEISGIDHKEVLRRLKRLEPASVEGGLGKFAPSSYRNKQNKVQPMLVLDEDQTMFIVTAFDHTTRARIIKEWSALKKEKVQKAQKVQDKKDTKKAIKELKTEISASLRQSDKKIIAKQTGMTESYVSDIISPVDFWGKKDVTIMDMAMTRAVKNKKLHGLYYSKQGAEALTHFLRTGEFREVGGVHE